MKLLFCSICNQLFNLSHEYQECKGNHCGGKYIDDLNAKVWGDWQTVFGLGFSNPTLSSAISNQLQHGDLPANMGYGGKLVAPGRGFTAFVMPDITSSIKRFDTKVEYDNH